MHGARPPSDPGASNRAAGPGAPLEQPEPPEPIDLSELLGLVGGAVGALFVGSGSRWVQPTARTVDEALAPLAPRVRTLAGLVLDAGHAVLHGVELDQVLGRMATLGQGAAGLRRALGRFDVDARWIEGLYVSLESARGPAGARSDLGERRAVLAAAIALSGRLPLGIDSAEVLARLEEPALGFAVGEAARAGDPGARATLRDAIGSEAIDDALALSLLFGLGQGAFLRGLEELVRLARGAIVEPARWASAALRAATVVGHAGRREDSEAGAPDADDRLIETMLEALALVSDADSGVAFLEALPVALQSAVVQRARQALTAHPPAARAAVVRAHLKETLFYAHDARAPRTPATDLLRERSPPVIMMILDLVARLGDAIPGELRATLARAWCDHPDAAVRRALATAIPARAPRPPSTTDEGAADVVALPPAALARDDLDRLRAALWSGESERIVELSTCVPLDRRAAARESLLSALEIPNAPLRRAIIDAIGRIGGQSDGPRLVDAARRYRALEGTVAAALRELGARAMAEGLAEIYRRRLKWADDDAVDDYCAIAGPEQVMHLLSALETRYYPSARAGAARAIARRRASEGLFALRTAALSDTQDNARLAALGALHELTGSAPSGDEIAGHALLFRSTEELPETVERAREAGPAAMAGIRRTIARGSWKRRRAACDVLATLPGPEATEVLVGVLEDPDEDVRFAAVEALTQRGWRPSTARERTLQALAARRIRELSQGASPGAVDVPTLVQALGLGGHVFRAEVLDALNDIVAARGFSPSPEEIGVIAAARMDVATAVMAPGGVDAVLRAVDHTWQANPHRARFVRELARLPSEELLAQLGQESPGGRPILSWRAREAIAQALERDGDEVALAALGRLVLEDDDDVRRAALQSLAWIGSPAAAREVARGFQSAFQEDRDLVARALGSFGPGGAEVVAELAEDTWWESRQGAAQALGHWRRDVQGAVDRLIALAVDPEYRVAHAAREALAAHGLMPNGPAVCAMIGKAQALTLEGLEPWLGLHRAATAPPEIGHRLDALIEELSPEVLPQRIGLIAVFRAEHLALWLEDVALGRETVPKALGRHVGARLAAADALRALVRCACPVCQGEGTVGCPACNGAGEVACGACQGRGTVMARCPDPACTAHGTLRRIDSRRCATCRGRGEVPIPCSCEGSRGRVPCTMCERRGRLGCVACEGAGTCRLG